MKATKTGTKMLLNKNEATFAQKYFLLFLPFSVKTIPSKIDWPGIG